MAKKETTIKASKEKETDPAKAKLNALAQALGNISDLNIGAHYRSNDMWGVFLRGENILNHRYYIGPAVPSQGIRCLAGATVRF